ncbi:DNA cytosine methyltransferase [Kitasatospora indigofera]|uniref:DNA cytosine methyltransferase n=1 Tax=Kitasatospora indigofera TaxID=67307 RepID=UPI003674B5F9
MSSTDYRYTAIDLCAGVGGQALGLETAGFNLSAALDIDPDSCTTMALNRPHWNVIEGDIGEIDPAEHATLDRADLLACGMPRSPYTVAGHRRATADKRDTLRAALDMASYVRPRAVLLENIPAFMQSPKFEGERRLMKEELSHLGYDFTWQVLDSPNFGVPQQRSHGFVVAMRANDLAAFKWPAPTDVTPSSLGETLRESMGARGWPEADAWADRATGIAPLVVGGATGRGGADLGPSRSKSQWARWGVYGGSIGDAVPDPDFRMDLDIEPRYGLPRVTVEQVALIQGFTPDWKIHGRKTSAYRQISQATPPAVAAAVARQVIAAFERTQKAGPL